MSKLLKAFASPNLLSPPSKIRVLSAAAPLSSRIPPFPAIVSKSAPRLIMMLSETFSAFLLVKINFESA